MRLLVNGLLLFRGVVYKAAVLKIRLMNIDLTTASAERRSILESKRSPKPCTLSLKPTWRPGGLTKSVISRVIIRVTPFRVLITLL